MELSSSVADVFINSLERHKEVDQVAAQEQEEKDQAIAESFPATAEDYMALEEPERLIIMRRLVRQYGPYEPDFDEPTAIFETDDANIEVKVVLEIEDGKYSNMLNSTYTDRYPAIQLWGWTVELDSGYQAYTEIGTIEYPAGENYNKQWVVGAPRVTQKTFERSGHNFRELHYRKDVQNPEEIEFVVATADAVACALILENVTPRRAIAAAV